MQDDLHINDKQYLIALTVFFFPYSLFEVSFDCYPPIYSSYVRYCSRRAMLHFGDYVLHDGWHLLCLCGELLWSVFSYRLPISDIF
jgi:hypothetical protein